IDGNSQLHITTAGIYWVENGKPFKPGRNDGVNEPTYINGKEWWPKWGNPNEPRGNDKTEMLELPIGSGDFDVEVIAVAKHRDDQGIEKRDPVTIKKVGEEWVVSIPDKQIGARWYTIRLSKVKGK